MLFIILANERSKSRETPSFYLATDRVPTLQKDRKCSLFSKFLASLDEFATLIA